MFVCVCVFVPRRYLDIVFSFIFQVSLLHESFNTYTIVGAAMVTSCAFVNPLKQWRAARAGKAIANADEIVVVPADGGEGVLMDTDTATDTQGPTETTGLLAAASIEMGGGTKHERYSDT